MRLPTGFMVAVALSLAPATANAQLVFEAVSQRALGMGGAFVAVADDATAGYWNPAGLATAGVYSATIEWNRSQFGNLDLPAAPGLWRRQSTHTAFGTLPVGLSANRLEEAAIVQRPDGSLHAETTETRQYGLTILQTVLPGVVVGTTLKYLRGSATSVPADGLQSGEILERALDARRDSVGRFDLDAGVMWDLERVRAGLTVRNVQRPEIGSIDGREIRLERQARFGLSVLPATGVTLAMDVDLNTVGLRDGLRRMIALGGESRLGGRLSVRGGVRWDLKGPRMPVATVGGSVSVRRGFWLDGHYASGRADGDRSFGVALRAGY